MNREELFKKIISKKEFSQIPEKDIETAFSHFEKRQTSDEEKIKLTRDLLRKVFSVFSSSKIFSLAHLKKKDESWFLKKHISSRERIINYPAVYKKIFKNLAGTVSVVDLGCGVNALSYDFFPKNLKIKYTGVEAIGQLADLSNEYFKLKKIPGKVFHASLFDLNRMKEIISEQTKPNVLFLFKVLDSLEMMEKNYSKEFLFGIVPLAEKVVISFATRSLISRKKFSVKRKWILDFIKKNFKILDDFELGNERYLIFKN